MTTRKAIEMEGIFYIALSAVLSGVFVWNNNRPNLPITLNNTSQVVVPLSPVAPRVEKASQISPDGSKNLVMNVTHNKDAAITYSFTTEDASGGNKKQIYTVTVDSLEKYSLPFNAWSPDNKYLFVYKGNSSNALVFRADGEPITENDSYVDLASEFAVKNPKHTLSEVTGWADPALVIFNALDTNGNKASFWLELPSKAVIPLSTQF